MWVLEMGGGEKRSLLSADCINKQTGNVGYGWITDMRVLMLYSCDHGLPTVGGLEYCSNTTSINNNFYSSSFFSV